MMFENPPRVEAKKKAPIGCHRVQLGLPTIEVKKGWEFVRFPFHYVDIDAEVPNEFCLFDLQPNYTEKEFKDFCYRATKIRDTFLPDGTFKQQNLEKWEGCQGYVTIGEDKNGYLVVKNFGKKE